MGKVCNKFKMAKHFDLHITDEAFSFTRNQQAIAAEAALDGIYVLRTSLPEHALGRDDVVGRYKDLADVERFFRTLNSELDVRPIRHRLAERVRAHMFLRMLSYYISWHMKQALAPILFADNDKPAAAAKRTDPVAPPNAPIKPSPRPPANAPKTTHRCTASPACSPTWPPSAPTTSNPPTTCQRSPRPPPPPAATASLRPPGRLPSPRPAVVSNTPQNPRSTRQISPNQGNFGLVAESVPCGPGTVRPPSTSNEGRRNPIAIFTPGNK
ncbi:putative transposase [Mycobacterium xenopi 4042]|uniref:Putative transposase n=1 Tax=Mycobacterium xenopi 4042 TaxID=1299334 RepID=X8DX81_MYCXE|nr:putative transposase [Mycobacterium xenopi 4042]